MDDSRLINSVSIVAQRHVSTQKSFIPIIQFSISIIHDDGSDNGYNDSGDDDGDDADNDDDDDDDDDDCTNTSIFHSFGY